MRLLKLAVAFAFVAAFTACGGGGGESAPEVTFTPSSVSTSFTSSYDSTNVNDNWPDDIEVVATFSERPSAKSFRVVADDPIVAHGGAVFVNEVSPTEYRATFSLDPVLPAGVYEGTFRLILCKDVACKQFSEAGALPYRVSVRAGFKVKLMVNGAPYEHEFAGLEDRHALVYVPSNSAVVFESNRAVAWEVAPCGEQSGEYVEQARTQRKLSATVRRNRPNGCEVTVVAIPKDGTTGLTEFMLILD